MTMARLGGETMAIIFVGNVDQHCTQDSIRSVFEVYGRVDQVTLTTHGAIIDMPNRQELDEAIRELRQTAWYLWLAATAA